MNVIKNNGEVVPYDSGKIKISLMRSRVSETLANEVLAEVNSRVRENMRTSDIFKIVWKSLKQKRHPSAARYNLRKALFRLGPAGFGFEKYVASILRSYGYEAEVPDHDLPGVCVEHEVDVVASKDGRRIMVEAKFRNEINGNVNLKDTMATWSRFLDLVDAGKVGKGQDFDELWIVTNARFSDRSRQFGECKGIRLVGWKYPVDYSFEQMVDNNQLYPLTILEDIKPFELARFADKNLMLCREIAKDDDVRLAEQTGLSAKRIMAIKNSCQNIIEL